MSSEWIYTTLGEFIRLQRGHDLTSSEQVAGNVPVMGSAGHNGWHNFAKSKGPGVVIGRSGASMGRVHFSDVDFWPHNTCLYVTDFLGNNPKYVYYYLQTLDLASYNSGSAQASLNRNLIYSIPVRKPARHIQDEIARIIGSLDDRITLLRETNATLEAIAQALFKSWFVDFDPVQANAAFLENGQAPSLPAEIQALFPSRLVESPQGLIPEGWEWSTIAQSFILTMGQSPPGDTYNEIGEGLPFYQGKTDYGFRFPTQRVFCTSPSRFANRGDCLVSVRAPVGDVNVALENCSLGRGVAGVRHPAGFSSFVLYSLKALKPHFDYFNGEGTVFGSINKKDFQTLPVIAAPESVQRAFGDIASGIDTKIENNELKLRTLTMLRDTLLPRLISGQLRLPEAEAALAEVG